MRIALIAGGLPFGGSTTFTLYLASGIKALGIPVEVFSLRIENPLKAEFEKANVIVHLQNQNRLVYEDRLRNTYEIVRKFAPTAAIAIIGTEAYDMLRYVPSGVARIGVVHDSSMLPTELIPNYRHALDYVAVDGQYLCDVIRRAAPGIPVVHIPLGIPLQKEPRMSAVGQEERLRLLYYGRLFHEPKRVRIFPDIVRALNDRRVPFTWTIHGKGPEEQFLRKRLSSEIESGNVRISAPVPGPALTKIIQACDVYLLASSEEGGPLTLLESMALGLVPVCGDIPGLVRDVINESNGFRVRGDDPDAYANAIAALHNDRRLLKSMSDAAYRTVTADYSQEALSLRYIRLIESLPSNKQIGLWQQEIEPKPIASLRGDRRFSPVGRWARRLNKRLRSIAKSN